MPRIGVSFPVTDRALFFASYTVTSQRPTEFAFAPIAAYDGLTGQAQNVPNSRLEPERSTQYEIGFRQRLTDRSAVSLAGFYRTQENKVTYRVLDAGFPAYGTLPQRRLHDDAGRRGQLRPPPDPEPAAERELHALVRSGHGLGRAVDLVGGLPRRPDPAVP